MTIKIVNKLNLLTLSRQDITSGHVRLYLELKGLIETLKGYKSKSIGPIACQAWLQYITE